MIPKLINHQVQNKYQSWLLLKAMEYPLTLDYEMFSIVKDKIGYFVEEYITHLGKSSTYLSFFKSAADQKDVFDPFSVLHHNLCFINKRF